MNRLYKTVFPSFWKVLLNYFLHAGSFVNNNYGFYGQSCFVRLVCVCMRARARARIFYRSLLKLCIIRNNVKVMSL